LLVPDAYEVTVEVSDTIQFFDAGTNWEKTLCPSCRRDVPIEWWQEAMDAAYSSGFHDLMSEVPCCGLTLSLNELHYDYPQGFARFALIARDPNVKGITESSRQELDDILNCLLRVIWSHY
jgi:hypothetical protein